MPLLATLRLREYWRGLSGSCHLLLGVQGCIILTNSSLNAIATVAMQALSFKSRSLVCDVRAIVLGLAIT